MVVVVVVVVMAVVLKFTIDVGVPSYSNAYSLLAAIHFPGVVILSFGSLHPLTICLIMPPFFTNQILLAGGSHVANR